MFPAKVAHYFIQRYSKPGDIILDPFSGRGTTTLQARVEGRRGISNDLNPLAYVLSRAKADPPHWEKVVAFLDALRREFTSTKHTDPDVSPDIKMLYHENTLRQLCFVRDRLLSKSLCDWTGEEFMFCGALAGIMHGSWRQDKTSQYLSISMPNTFSMSPGYVQRFIQDNGLTKLDQNVFECLRDKLARLYLDDTAGIAGRAHYKDAGNMLRSRSLGPGSVDLVLTSPPYLEVVNYGTANWIRLWLLGIEEVGRDQGVGRRTMDAALDHRHTYNSYKEFMLRTLLGVQRVLKRDGVAVFVIGDVKYPGKQPRPLAAQLWGDVQAHTKLRLLDIIEDDLPARNKVSRIWGETKGQATSRDCALVLAHADGEPIVQNAEIDWGEPYCDGGPDAAHEHLRRFRISK
jgi:DNA methylase